MDNSNETSSSVEDFPHEYAALENLAVDDAVVESEKSETQEESDDILSELNNRSKKLEICITARRTSNKLKEKLHDCEQRIKKQEQRIKEAKLRHAETISTEHISDEISEYKHNVKQNCVAISEYARKMSQDIDSNSGSISTLTDKIKQELDSIKGKTEIVIALQEQNKFFQDYSETKKQYTSAENRFQIALADYKDNN